MSLHTIALVAHDHKKDALIEWARANKDRLSRHSLVATGTTGKMLSEQVGLEVRQSFPLTPSHSRGEQR